MKKTIKEFLLRGMSFGGLGPVIAGIVYFIISFFVKYTLTPSEVFVGIISSYLLAFIHSGISVINQIEMSMMKKALLHGSILYVTYLLCYVINEWIERDIYVILIFTSIFIFTYAVVWIIVYFCAKNATKKLNNRLGN